ncbi:MAG TPA: hypothetical protein PLC74_07705, partial [Acetobacteraceae bacterium]|nr:hypothetical protein [Acetobacteraceae bacterium]
MSGAVTVDGSVGALGPNSTIYTINVTPSLQATAQNMLDKGVTSRMETQTSYFDVVTLAGGAGSIPAPQGTTGLVPPTNFLFLTGTGGGAVTIPAYNNNTSAGFQALMINEVGNETVTGGGILGNMVVTSAQSNVTYDPQAGYGTIIGGGGNNDFTLDGTSPFGPGNYTVLSSTGNSTINANIGQDVISLGTGANLINL